MNNLFSYYLFGAVGTLAWHQVLWKPLPIDEEWERDFPEFRSIERKPDPKDRIATDILRSICWVPKMAVGSLMMLDDFTEKMDKNIKKSIY
jgi:hypothetical protein